MSLIDFTQTLAILLMKKYFFLEVALIYHRKRRRKIPDNLHMLKDLETANSILTWRLGLMYL